MYSESVNQVCVCTYVYVCELAAAGAVEMREKQVKVMNPESILQ